MEALFVDRLKIVDVAELEEYTGGRFRQGERATVMQNDNHALSSISLSSSALRLFFVSPFPPICPFYYNFLGYSVYSTSVRLYLQTI